MIPTQESSVGLHLAASMIQQHYMPDSMPATVMQQQQAQQQLHNQQQRQQSSTNFSGSSASASPNQSDNNSMSTATPPHQISQRASPASTALVMSNNNINGAIQPSSRQLTPNTSSSNNGTGSSSNGNTGQHNGAGGGVDGAPNPMVRQFALHAKSMSAGIVVPVPGISNNLATATGMNQNNIINNNIASNHHHQPPLPHHSSHHSHHRHHHHRTNGIITGNSNGSNSMVPPHNDNSSTAANHHRTSTGTNSSSHHHTSINNNNNDINNSVMMQPVHAIAPHRTSKSSHHRTSNHHHKQLSQPNQHHHHLQQPQHPQTLSHGLYQHHTDHHQHDHPQVPYHTNDSSEQFLHGPPSRHQATSSSIILSTDNNLNNIHIRSASTHLSNVLLGSNAPTHHSSSISQQHQSSRNFHHQQQQHAPPQHMSNSIWTIGENISKSHGKLTASGYLPQPYLFTGPSTNVSCDNISNPSRLIDGAPAPGYYLHASGNLPNSNAHISTSGSSIKTPEFLPICDLMFNLISMIIYFCESTFGIIALIALYYHAANKQWALMGTLFVVASNIICQYTSLRWIYKMKLDQCEREQKVKDELAENDNNCERRCYNRMTANMRNYPCGSCNWLPEGSTEVQLKFLISIVLHAISHIFCLGFLVRYIRLVIPVTDTARVKKEARDLCMLRLIHGFVQSAPLLLLQAYLIASQNSTGSVANLSMISAILSLVNVCWSLASFTKYARKKYMHKFVLTWLGIMSQFLWRLGTVSSRIATLVIYAVYYNYWMLVILALHWLTMFCWLMKPGNLLRDEVNMSRAKKLAHALGTSWIYCFCYVNFEEHNSRAKIGSFYMIMFFENNVLFSVCLFFTSQSTWFKSLSMLVVYLGFALGMVFMYLYYKYFHVSALDNGLSCSQDSIDSIADQLSPAGKKIAGFKPGTLRLRSEDSLTSDRRFVDSISATLRTGSHPEIARGMKPPYLGPSQISIRESGVFDCKLNPRTKDRKSVESYQCP